MFLSSEMRRIGSTAQRRSLLAVLLTVALGAALLSSSSRPAQRRLDTSNDPSHTSSSVEQLSATHIRWNGDVYVRQADTSVTLHTSHFGMQLDDDKAAKKQAKAAEKADKKSEDMVPMFSGEWWLAAGCAFACVCIAALAAGLTVGLVSLDPFDLQVILETEEADMETEEEKVQLRRDKKSAGKLLPIVRRHHLLLVTLLLLNSAANETLPLFLDRLVPSWVAVVISVTLVLVFGEILPSAIFTGSGQLRLAALLVPVVWLCMVGFSFIAWPISKVLDWWLGDGDEQELFKRGELKALVRMQSAHASTSTSTSTDNSEPSSPNSLTSLLPNSRSTSANTSSSSSSSSSSTTTTETKTDGSTHEAGLATDEIAIITGALEMKVTTVGQVCLAWEKVFALSTDDTLNYDTLARMLAVGHSRIPVYSEQRNNVVGVMLTKRLIVINPEDERKVSTLSLRRPMFVSPQMSLYDCLNEFQRGVSHLVIVCDQPTLAEEKSKAGEQLPDDVGIRGIVTLEDLLERLIKEEIVDETDPHGVMAELAGVQRRKRRVAAFRKAALHRQRMMGGASTVLGVIKEERSWKRAAGGTTPRVRGSGGGGGGGLHHADRLRLITTEPRASPSASSPVQSAPLLTPSSAHSDGGYGSTDDSGRNSTMSVTTKRWLKATEKVVGERHVAEKLSEQRSGGADNASKG